MKRTIVNTPLIIALAGLALVACQKKNEYAAPPPAAVTVAAPVEREQVVYANFPATLEGVEEVDVRARVRGILEETYFEDGKLVKAGDKLFKIEQEAYQAAVEVAEADLTYAKAAHGLAVVNLGRLKEAGPQAVSESSVDIAKAEMAQAAAVVDQKEATLQEVSLDLEYTIVVAPISGRISRSFVDKGNLVDGGEATLLANITDDTKVYVYAELPETNMLNALRMRDSGGLEYLSKQAVRLELADGSIYPESGHIDFLDSRVDTKTRTATVRAVFESPNGLLTSGLYGLMGYPHTYPNKEHPNVLLIPSYSVLRDLGGDYVWVVDASNTVHRRGVEVGPTVPKPTTDENAAPERETLILKGLTTEDRVIVNGLQRVREGAVVAPELAGAPVKAAAAPTASK